MSRQLFTTEDGRLRVIWRLSLFALAFVLLVAPLILVPDSRLQFLLADIVLVALLLVWARLIDRRPFAAYGLTPSLRQLGELIAGLAIGVISVAVMFGVSLAFGAIERVPAGGNALGWAAIAFAAKMLLVGFGEETVFRGLVYTNFRDGLEGRLTARNAIAGAVLLSSLLFGLVHLGTDHFSAASLALLSLNGIVFCVPFVLTGRLALSIGLHAAWNYAQSSMFGFAMSGNAPTVPLIVIEDRGPAWWTGGAYGPEAGAVCVLGFAVMVSLTLLFIRLSNARDRGSIRRA